MVPHHPRVEKMVEWGARFARRSVLMERPMPWIVLAGKTGCGKSRVAKRALRIVRENAIRAHAAGFAPPGDRLARVAVVHWPTVAGEQEETYTESTRDIREADVALLDDIGAETDQFKAGVPNVRLMRLLDDLERKALIVTTNIRRSQWVQTWGERVASRLSAAHTLDCFDVPDFRAMKGAKA
jgi:DNA replication protein DnaC